MAASFDGSHGGDGEGITRVLAHSAVLPCGGLAHFAPRLTCLGWFVLGWGFSWHVHCGGMVG
jgi:hypothetical protein